MRKFACPLFFLVFAVSCYAQKADLPALELCRQGKAGQALAALESASKDKAYKNDPEVWSCLSIASNDSDDLKNAVKYSKKAVSLAPNVAVYIARLAYDYLTYNKIADSIEEAKAALKLDAKDALALTVLGTAYYRVGKLDEANEVVDRLIADQPQYGTSYLLKSGIIVAMMGKHIAEGAGAKKESVMLAQAVEVLKLGAARVKDNAERERLLAEEEQITPFVTYYTSVKDEGVVTTDPEPGYAPLKVIAKPRAEYTEKARRYGVNGSINLLVLFRADGRVGYVIRLNSLGYGLDESAIRAVLKIQFEPETRDGKPVPVVKHMVYSFTLY